MTKLLTSYLLLALALTILFSCADYERDNPNDPKAGNYVGNGGSSSDGVSSSLSSSSAISLSSSSTGKGNSSSSSLNRSSSAGSSSSTGQGNSSSAGSSSSIKLSSSSVSSSSATGGGSCDGFVNGTKRSHYGMQKEQFCDSRDGKKYVYVKIGTQTWMAENLNYGVIGDNTYGNYYNWAKANTACPSGWHLPSNAEWQTLIDFAGGDETAGRTLKTTDSPWVLVPITGGGMPERGWDTYGFSALPGGGDDYGYGSTVGYNGYWWSADEYDGYDAYYWSMWYGGNNAYCSNYNKSNYWFSVRCVKS